MWYVDGTGADVSFSIHSDGHWSIAGHGKHYCRPSAGDFSFLSKIGAVKEMSWRMHSCGTEQASVDIARSGVWKRFNENPIRSLASISYLSGNSDTVCSALCANNAQRKIERPFLRPLQNNYSPQ